MKFSLANIWGLRSNFIDCESFHNSNFPDILVLYETNLDDSIDSGNFSVRGYLPLIQKDSGNIFYKYQSGFRNNHSTDLFLSFLNDKILKGFGNAIYTGMILIDLQKAYTLGSQFILWKCSFDICSLLYNFKQNLMQLFCVTCSLSFSFFEEFGYQAVQE